MTTVHDVGDATLRILIARGIGGRRLAALRAAFGDDDRIVGATVGELAMVDGIGRRLAERLRYAIDASDPATEREAMHAAGVSIVVAGSEAYPMLLGAIPDPPPALWVRGVLEPEDAVSVAIVGARQCTAYGRDQAGRFAAALGDAGLTLVSGGARGVDGEVHRAAVRVNGRTIAVLGCGVDVAYPPEHRDLFEQIAATGGAVVSEHPMGTPPRPRFFPRRNRVISGLSLGVLVVEAGRRSGALITARIAVEDHGREAFAIPGRVDSPASAGCHLLIRDGAAALVSDVTDVLAGLDSAGCLIRGASDVGRVSAEGGVSGPAVVDVAVTESQREILARLQPTDFTVIEDVAVDLQKPITEVQADVTWLQIRGLVIRDHRGVRRRVVTDRRP